MYKVVKIVDTVRLPPEKFGEDQKAAILDILRRNYEGIIDEDVGSVLAIIDVENIGVGRVIMGDGASHHETVFTALVYKPELHEIILGEVVEIVGFGAFVRLGPIDGLIHVSQIMDDYVNYDSKKATLAGKETNRKLTEGNRVRARIVSVSVQSSERERIGLTMRQPGLGRLEWIEEERKEKKSVASG